MVYAAKKIGLPCAIIQNYHYHPNKQELVCIQNEGWLGRLRHILGRYACNYPKYGSWGKFWRQNMGFGLLFAGSVHHFDMFRFLSGGDCETLIGYGWNPGWSRFEHHSSGRYLMRLDNNMHTFYEGNSSAAGINNCWYRKNYRAEFESGTVEIAEGNTVHIHRSGQETEVYESPAIPREGPPPPRASRTTSKAFPWSSPLRFSEIYFGYGCEGRGWGHCCLFETLWCTRSIQRQGLPQGRISKFS